MYRFRYQRHTIAAAFIIASLGAGMSANTMAQQPPMTFFITSEGPGDGANLGGL